jgi:very-short-patch-repair endonuclease
MNEFARLLRKSPTDAEWLLWSKLHRRQLGDFKFRRQQPIGPYVCVEARVIVELDGAQHVDESKYDTRRDAILRSNGYRVLRFWNTDVLHQTESVLETIFEAVHRPQIDGRIG